MLKFIISKWYLLVYLLYFNVCLCQLIQMELDWNIIFSLHFRGVKNANATICCMCNRETYSISVQEKIVFYFSI